MTDKHKGQPEQEQQSNITLLPVKTKPQKLPFHIKLAERYLELMEQRGRDLRVVPDSEGQNHFWKYENGLWTLLLDNEVGKWLAPELQTVLNDDLDQKRRSNNKLFSEATQHIIRSPTIREPLLSFVEWDAHGKIPTKAGLIDPLTLEIESIRKEHYCTWRLDIEYNPDAKCPKWEQMLADAFSDRTEEDRIKSVKLLQEVEGVSLLGKRPKALNRELVLWGPPDSGKSALLYVMSGLISANPITTSFKELSGPHGLQPFLRRGVPWVLHEAFDAGVWHHTSETKMIISGDPIPINPKNGKPITIKPNNPAMHATNHPPKFKDSSGAMVARLLIIPFTKTFDRKNPIGVAAEARQTNSTWEPQDLILNTERAGVFNWALAGVKCALERGHFVNTAAGDDVLEEVRKESNVVAGFLNDCVDYDANVMISTVDFYAAFTGWWTEQHGDEKAKLSPSLVGLHLADLCDPLIAHNKNKIKDRTSMRFYVGIKLNETAGKQFFESKLVEDLSGKIHPEIARMSVSYQNSIRPISATWLGWEEIIKLKAAHAAKAGAKAVSP